MPIAVPPECREIDYADLALIETNTDSRLVLRLVHEIRRYKDEKTQNENLRDELEFALSCRDEAESELRELKKGLET